jgi:ATP-dependent Clp endopeptidase proteolytic subunit ClpP
VEAAAKGKGGGEILIFSHIGKRYRDDTDAVDTKAFVEALEGLVKAGPGDVLVRINSPGGDVAAGMTIYNALRSVRNRVVCRVEGSAYSMASVIALAGRETQMADVGMFMLHNPSTMAWGGTKEMEAAIAQLRTARSVLLKAYTKKSGKPAAEIEALMDETTFMTAEEAKAFGFVDVVLDGEESVEEGRMAACFDAGAWAAFYQGAGPMPEAVDSGQLTVDSGPPEAAVEDGGAVAPVNDAGADAREENVVMLSSKEIREACPGASAEFVLGQVEASEGNEKYGLVDVLKAWAGAKALEAERAARAAAEAAAEEARAAAPAANGRKAPGVDPLASGASEDSEEESGDPIAAFEAAVESRVKKGMSKLRAVREVTLKEPGLHQAYLRAYNEEYGGGAAAV